MGYIAFLVSQDLPGWFLNSKNWIAPPFRQWGLALTVVCLGLDLYRQQFNLCHAKAIYFHTNCAALNSNQDKIYCISVIGKDIQKSFAQPLEPRLLWTLLLNEYRWCIHAYIGFWLERLHSITMQYKHHSTLLALKLDANIIDRILWSNPRQRVKEITIACCNHVSPIESSELRTRSVN